MAVNKTFVCDLDPSKDGLALTYIVPTNACDLKCPFCFIAQRNEAGPRQLSPDDYAYFIRDVATYVPVRVSGLQGYEPLLDDSWPFTEKILEVSNEMGIPTSLVTNGTHLAKRMNELAALDLKDLTVSLDAADSESHDRQRGVRGAFNKTVAGIKAAVRTPKIRERLCVAAVLVPSRRVQLDTLPAFLADLGVRYFGVTPLLRAGSASSPGRIVQNTSALLKDLDVLSLLCEKSGITFVVDDELRQVNLMGTEQYLIHRLARPERLVRLTPSGACSSGMALMETVSARTPIWHPKNESPREFLKLLSITPEKYQMAA